jgi:hypothetical protein
MTVAKAPSSASFDHATLATTTAENPTNPVVTIAVTPETAPFLEIDGGQVAWKLCASSATVTNLAEAEACSAVTTLTGVTTSGTLTTATSDSERTFTIPLGQIPYAGSYKLVAVFSADTSIGNTWAVQDVTVTKVGANVVLNDCAPNGNVANTVTSGYSYAGNSEAYGTCANSLLFNSAQLGTADAAKLNERGANGSSAYINSSNKIYLSVSSADIAANLSNAGLKADTGSSNNNSNPALKTTAGGKVVLNYYSADGTRIATSSHTLADADIVNVHQTMYGAVNGVAKKSALYGFSVPDSVSQTAGTYYVLGCFTGDSGYNFDCYNQSGEEIPESAFGANETTTGNFDFTSTTVAQNYIGLGKMRTITINKAPYGAVTTEFRNGASCSTGSTITPTTLDANQYLCVQVVTKKDPETTWNASGLDNFAPGEMAIEVRNDSSVRTEKSCSTGSWVRKSANTYTCLITLNRAASETLTSATSPNALIDIAGTTVFTPISDVSKTFSVSTAAPEYYLTTFSDSTNFTSCATTLTIGCDALKVRVKVGSDLAANGTPETGNIWASGDVTIRIEQCDPDETSCGTGTDIDITATVLSPATATLSAGTATFNLLDALSEFDYPAGKYKFSLVGYAGDTTFTNASGTLASKTVDFGPTTSHVDSKLTLGSNIATSTDISSPETAIVGQIVNVFATVYKYDVTNTLYGGHICANMIDDATSDYQIVVKNSANNPTFTSSETNLNAVVTNCSTTPNGVEYTAKLQIPQSAFAVAGTYTVTLTWNGNDSYTSSSNVHTITVAKVPPGVSGHASKLDVKAHNQSVTTTTSLEQSADIILKVPTGVSPIADNAITPTKGYVQIHYFNASSTTWGTDELDGFNSANLAITTAMQDDCPDPSGDDDGFECYYLNEPMPKYINTVGNYVLHAQYFANEAVADIDDTQADDIYGAFEVTAGATALSSDEVDEFDMLNADEVSATVHLRSTEYSTLPNRCSDGSAVTETPDPPNDPTYSCTTGTLIPAGVPDSTKNPTDVTDGQLLWQIWATDVIGNDVDQDQGQSGQTRILTEELRSGEVSATDDGYNDTLLVATDILGEIATITVPLGTYVQPGLYVLRYAFCDDLALLDSHDETPDTGTTCANSVFYEQDYIVTQPDSYIEVNFDSNENGIYCFANQQCVEGQVGGDEFGRNRVTFYMPRGQVIGSYPEAPATPYEIPELTVHDGYNFLGYTTENPPVWVPEVSEPECEGGEGECEAGLEGFAQAPAVSELSPRTSLGSTSDVGVAVRSGESELSSRVAVRSGESELSPRTSLGSTSDVGVAVHRAPAQSQVSELSPRTSLGSTSDGEGVGSHATEDGLSTWSDLSLVMPEFSSITFYAQYSDQFPSIESDKVQYIHGEYIYISGENFAPNQVIDVGLSNGLEADAVTFPFVKLTTITTDENGSFSLPFNVPNSSVVPVGDYEIVVKDMREHPVANVSVNFGSGHEIEIVPTLEDVIIEDEVLFEDGGADVDGYVNLTSNVKMSIPDMPVELLPEHLKEQLVIRYELSHNAEIMPVNCDNSRVYDDESRPEMKLDKEHKWVQFSAMACLPNGARSVPITKTFELNTYTLSFNANGGTLEDEATMDSIEIAQGDQFALPINAFSAPENAPNFLGWAVSEELANADNPTIEYFDEAQFVAEAADVTLYAIWRNFPTAPVGFINYFSEQICGLGGGVEYVVYLAGEESELSPRTSLGSTSDVGVAVRSGESQSSSRASSSPSQESELSPRASLGSTSEAGIAVHQAPAQSQVSQSSPMASSSPSQESELSPRASLGSTSEAGIAVHQAPAQSQVSKSSSRASLESDYDSEGQKWIVAASSTGCVDLVPEWLGQEIVMTYVVTYGTTDKTMDLISFKQDLEVPKRPATPQAVVVANEQGVDLNDGIIGNVNDKMEYAVSEFSSRTSLESNSEVALTGLQWTPVPKGATKLTGLVPGIYLIRVAASQVEEVVVVPEQVTELGRSAVRSGESELSPRTSSSPSQVSELSPRTSLGSTSDSEVVEQVAEQTIAVAPQAEYIITSGNFVSLPQELSVAKFVPEPQDQGGGQTIVATGVHVLQLLLLLLLMTAGTIGIVRRRYVRW